MTTRLVKLDEIIPEEAWPEIDVLVATGKDTAKDFLPVLMQYEKAMLANGVLPSYAAYAIEFAVMKKKGLVK